ncbi:MAG TPA: adenylate/guanylate cyclase domain-containing protein [Thermoanaerobaculia bacterium]|nr:adenylate/guanylate cyclase domain-containing protein [Thermoanaerobaculia bacterium]
MLQIRWSHQGREEIRALSRDEIKLGRGSENDVVLPDFSVSRRHAVLRRESEGWAVHDLGSTNGVQVNKVVVRKALVRSGDRLKIGIFEIDLEDAGGSAQPTIEAVRSEAPPEPQPEPAPAPPIPVPAGTATIVRAIAEFSEAYGLEPGSTGAARLDKRRALEQSYSTKIFSFMTRLARLLIRSESVDDVLARVFELAFETLPVDRGFILLRDEKSGEPVCEVARVKDRIEFRPEGDVPVSRTMVDQVMRDRVALLTYDAQADQRLAGGESIRIHQIRAAMCAPLWSGEKIIGVLQVDTPFHAGTFNEQDLDLLTALANFAAVAVEKLRNAKIAEFERQVRARLERYHSPSVIESIVTADPAAAESAMGRVKAVEATVVFADLAGFTALSEKLAPGEVATLLEEFFTPSVEAIFELGGTLDKFIGDCVMAFFGAPVAHADHAVRAVRAALRILDAHDEWNAGRSARGLPTLPVRIAINSGPVVVGDVGSRSRVDYTVLGNTVNVCARLEAYVGEAGEITIGEETERLLGGEIPCEALGEFQLKGLETKVRAFRVVRGSAS